MKTVEVAQTQTIKSWCDSRCVGGFSSLFADRVQAP
jgi:hypothetical protein